MEQHSAELNALTKDKIDEFKRTSMHNRITMNWLKSHHADKAKLQYLFFPEELYKHCEINDLFRGFDQDQSDGIEVSELISMFKDNKIKLERSEIEAIFHLVDANGDNTLNLSEFKRSVFSDEINQAFAKLMRNYRIRQEIKKNYQESYGSLPRVENSQRQCVIPDQQQDGLKQQNENIKEYGSKNELDVGVALIDQEKLTSKRSIQSCEKIDEKDEQQRVIPSTFASMVEYFSYNFQRKEQIKKCSMMPSTQAIPKAIQLENLMQLSSKYTDQTLAKIYKLHDRYSYKSFDSLSVDELGLDEQDIKEVQIQDEKNKSVIDSSNKKIRQFVEQREQKPKIKFNNTNKETKQIEKSASSEPQIYVFSHEKTETPQEVIPAKSNSFWFPKTPNVQPFSINRQSQHQSQCLSSTANISQQSPSTSISRSSSKKQFSKHSFPNISATPKYTSPLFAKFSTPLPDQAISILSQTIASQQHEEQVQTKQTLKLAKLLKNETSLPSQNVQQKVPFLMNQSKTGRHSLHTNSTIEQQIQEDNSNKHRQSHFLKTFFNKPMMSKTHKKNVLSEDTTFLSSQKTMNSPVNATQIVNNNSRSSINLFETPQISQQSSILGSFKKQQLKVEEQYLKDTMNKLNTAEKINKNDSNVSSGFLNIIRKKNSQSCSASQLQIKEYQQEVNKAEVINDQQKTNLKGNEQLDEYGDDFKRFSFQQRSKSQQNLMLYPPKAKRISVAKINRSTLNSSSLQTDTCFKDTMFKDKVEDNIKITSQEELLPQRDLADEKKQQLASRGTREISTYSRETSSTRPGLRSQNNFFSQASFKKIDSLTHTSNFLSTTPLATIDKLTSTLANFYNHKNTNKSIKTAQSKRQTFH